VIRYEWRTELSVDEAAQVRALLEGAAEFDSEPEFSTIEFDDVQADLEHGGPTKALMLLWMLPRHTRIGEAEEPEVLAGVLRMVIDRKRVGHVQLVIEPQLRSLGIVTLFVEKAGLDVGADGGWLRSGARGLSAWAQGNHPAAGRLANRHYIPRTQRVWKLIRPVADPWNKDLPTDRVRVLECGADARTVADLSEFVERVADTAQPASRLVRDLDSEQKTVLVATDESGVVMAALTLGHRPVDSIEFGKCLVAEHVSRDPNSDPLLNRALLVAASSEVGRRGSEGVVVYVDSDDTTLVNACRLTHFQHDRTDVQFAL
jgi:mycothiol synthase